MQLSARGEGCLDWTMVSDEGRAHREALDDSRCRAGRRRLRSLGLACRERATRWCTRDP